MISFISKSSKTKKILSTLLAFTFLFYNVSYAGPKDIAPPNIPFEKTALAVDDIGIGIDTGTIKSTYSGNTGKTIIHIQDAHCNFEAQSNINKILDQLTKECGINMISVEGAEGIVDTAWFRAFPDAEIRQEVATYFMKKGEITGAEFFSINSDYPGIIYGAETREYYIKNLKAFTDVYPYKESIEKYFSDLRVIAQRLKGLIYTPKLKELDSKIRGFDKKDIELSDFAAYLEKVCKREKIGVESYLNFKKLLQTLEYEDKIDFDIVDQERSQYIDLLGKKLPKEEMTELVAQSIKFKKGHIKAVDFYFFLRELAKQKKIDMVNEFPNLFYYYIYTKLYDGIDNEGLFKEINAIQTQLKIKLFRSETEEQLDKNAEIIDMFIDLVNIELTNDDYDQFKVYSNEFSLEGVVTFVSMLSNRYNLRYNIDPLSSEISDKLPNMVDFYEIAMVRDEALIDNTLKKMDEDGRDKSIFIAGGFHTRGIKKLLEKKGISYVVITPKITKDVETPYIKVLTNQRTTLEDIITDSGPMPTAGKQMVSAQAKMLAALSRAKGAQYFLSAEGREFLNKLEADLASGVEGADWVQRSIELIRESNGKYLRGWIAVVKKDMDEEEWKDRLIHPAEWAKFAKEFQDGMNARIDEINKERKAAGESKYMVSVKEKQGILLVESNVSKKILEAIRLEQIKTETPGKQHMAERKTEYTAEEAENLNRAINETIVVDKVKGIYNSVTGGVFYVLDDARFDRAANRYNAPKDLLCHPGTDGTRKYYDPKNHKATYPHVKKNFYIRKSVFDQLSLKDRDIVAAHEKMHIDIALRVSGLVVPDGMLEEDYVNSFSKTDVRPIMAKLGQLDYIEMLKEEIAKDNEYGDTNEEILHKVNGMQNQARKAWIRGKKDEALKINKEIGRILANIYVRRSNIDKMHNVLTADTYEGYDVVIIVSSFEEERQNQKEIFERAFNGVKTQNGILDNKVVVLSVLDDGDGGQVIGHVNAWRNAQIEFGLWAGENNVKADNLDELFKEGLINAAIYQNGGKGSRYSPGTQGFYNSRAAQPVIGETVNKMGDSINLDLLTTVVLSTARYAASMDADESRLDVYWTNQIGIGTEHATNVVRTNFLFDKFVVRIPSNPKPKDVHDYGMGLVKDGRMVQFFANKQFAEGQGATFTIKDDEVSQGVVNTLTQPKSDEMGVFDYGSYSVGYKLHNALMEYWVETKEILDVIDKSTKTKDKAGIARDIDPSLVQVIVPISNGLLGRDVNALRDKLPTPQVLKDLEGTEEKEDLLEEAYYEIISTIAGFEVNADFQTTNEWEKAVDKDRLPFIKALEKTFTEKRDNFIDGLDFFLINIDMFLDNLAENVGYIDKGEEAHWLPGKRLLDMANDKFIMLNDINGTVQFLGDTIRPDGQKGLGSIVAKATMDDENIGEDTRRLRKINKDHVATFMIEGHDEVISLTLDQVRKGWSGYGVTIKGSVIQGFTVLKKGSKIVNSVLDNVQGKIVSKNSYIQSTVLKSLEATDAIVVNVAGDQSERVVKKILTDTYRDWLVGAKKSPNFPKGQVRAGVPLSFDPKGKEQNDGNTTDRDGVATLKELRETGFNKTASQVLEKGIRFSAFYKIFNRQLWIKIFKAIKFGTSGLRSLVANMTDMEVSVNTAGFIAYLEGVGDIDKDNPEKNTITIGGDLRPSTPRIMRAVAKVVEDAGYEIDMVGQLPSPAISYRGVLTGNASIVVTGSHIPFDRTGIKFNRAKGEEVLKADEAGILENVSEARKREYAKTWDATEFDMRGFYKNPAVTSHIVEDENYEETREAYINRYVEGMPKDLLKGKYITFFQHSSVGRDINVEILERLGATVRVVGRTEYFIPIDTEKVSPDMKKYLAQLAKEPVDDKGNLPDAVLSQDGDADRPLVASNTGEFVPGDKIGALVSIFLGVNRVSFPTSAVDVVPALMKAKGIAANKTDIGSPFVIEDMNYQALKDASALIAGWEVNGGYMLGSEIQLEGAQKSLTRLATRDAILPMLVILAYAKQENQTLDEFFDEKLRHPETGEHRHNGAGVYGKFEKEFNLNDEKAWELMGLTKDSIVPALKKDKYLASINFKTHIVERSKGVTYNLEETTIKDIEIEDAEAWTDLRTRLQEILTPKGFGEIDAIEALSRREKDAKGNIIFKYLAGTKITFDDGRVMHLRPSGNATEFRIYATANTIEEVDQIINMGEQTIPELAENFMPRSAGAQAIKSGGYDSQTDLERVLEKMLKTKEFEQEIDKSGFQRAIIVLDGQIRAKKPIQQKTFFRLGNLNNYKWGQNIKDSAILNAMGYKTMQEKVDYLYNNLTHGQLVKLKAGYDMKLRGEKVENLHKVDIANVKLSVQTNAKAFEDWAKNFLSTEKVSERWFTAGDIVVGNYRLPVSILKLWPGEVFGDEIVNIHGAENFITSKHLASDNELSVQMHMFDEVITASEDGYAYFGLKESMPPTAIRIAARKGNMKDILNRVELKKGETYIVKAYTIHAYGADVVVDETKAVSAAKDAIGTISFGDDLARTAEQLKEIDRLIEKYKDSPEIGIEEIVKAGLLRENKDFRTMNPEKVAETMEWLARAKTKGALDGYKGYTPDEIRESLKAPDYGAPETGNRFVPTAKVAGSLISGNYKLDKDGSIVVDDAFKNKLHTLIVFDGKMTIETDTGSFVVEKGRDVIMPANMGEYKIIAKEGPVLISAKVVNMPESIDRTLVFEEGDARREQVTVELQNPGDGKLSNVIDRVELGTTEKVDALDVMPLIDGREHTVMVTQGTLEVAMNRETVVLERGEKLTVSSDELQILTAVKLRYEFINPSDAEPVVFKVDYEKTDTEEAEYAVFETMKKHIGAVTDFLEQKEIVLILPQEMFIGSENESKDEVGSLNWHKSILDRLGSGKISIKTYQSSIGLDGAAARFPKKDEEIFILGAPNDLLQKGVSMNERTEEFLTQVGLLSLPEIDKLKNLNSIALAVEGTAVMQAILNVDDITKKDEYASDMADLMSMMTDKTVTIDDLYYMLPFYEVDGKIKIEDEATGELVDIDFRNFILTLAEKLSLRPIEPYDPRAELQSRLKVMYSL